MFSKIYTGNSYQNNQKQTNEFNELVRKICTESKKNRKRKSMSAGEAIIVQFFENLNKRNLRSGLVYELFYKVGKKSFKNHRQKQDRRSPVQFFTYQKKENPCDQNLKNRILPQIGDSNQ